jgi:asparagine synthase (glutamine-hydrolysing)
MCGIAGILVPYPLQHREFRESLTVNIETMVDRLRHRGPEGKGIWLNEDLSVALGHSRLSVIDLSGLAAQPMHYSAISGTDATFENYTITYNGEIYNYIELREELKDLGYTFRTRSDTEVILAAYDCWKEECLQRFDGMFAFAIWDNRTQSLFAARDRFGEKPFFYYSDEKHFIFASEMKALWAIGIEKLPDHKMLANYLALGYVQNAYDKKQTFYENIAALPPAHYLKYTLHDHNYHLFNYWKLDKDTEADISEEEAKERFTELLTRSVSRRLRSDVAIGSSLSGGLDSSVLAALIKELRSDTRPHQTFSALFPGFEKNEGPHIDTVTRSLEFENHSVEPSAAELHTLIDRLCYFQEEPFPSSSIFAQYKVFEMARNKGVTVLLDGQGADEALAGYHKYIHWHLQQLVDRSNFSTARQEKEQFRKHGVPVKWGPGNYLAIYLPAHTAIHLEWKEYRRMVQQPDLDPGFLRSLRGREWEGVQKPIITKLNDILYFNTMMLGLEELLRFSDRNSMAHGLEVRLPFLSHELVEFIFTLPASFKMSEGYTKWIMRKAFQNRLPDSIIWRSDKVGYEPPQKKWMQESSMNERIRAAKEKLIGAGILKKTALEKAVVPLGAHEAGNYDWRYLCAAPFLS